jgi:hypothetical protein
MGRKPKSVKRLDLTPALSSEERGNNRQAHLAIVAVTFVA